MNNSIQINPIGSIHSNKNKFWIKINRTYKAALTNINGFSHLQIVWWGNLFDQPTYREQLVTTKPYKNSPEQIGVFATRSQIRPNPILITTIFVQKIDIEQGLIYTPYIDAENNSPLLDIKPYHAHERVKNNTVPEWCQHWPKWYEESAAFDWQNEFNF